MKRLALALAACACALTATACAGGDEKASAQLGSWERIEPGGRTACARGDRYAFWWRGGRKDKLLVYFEPGGGCFDVNTCAPGSSWFDDSVDDGHTPAHDRGIFALGDGRNPFRDYSMLYVPSCTGDVHLGDRVQTYRGEGMAVKIHHRGHVNARAALRHAFRRIRWPDAVFVAGCSAGSVGSAFHAPAIIERYPEAQVTQLGDSLGFVFHRPIRLVDYGAHRLFPRFFRIGNRPWTMTQYLQALTRRYPSRTFARLNYSSDDVQEQFFAAVGGRQDGFEPRLRGAERTLKRRPNYRSYLACGDEHCALPFDRFYSLRVEGVRLRDWVADLARGKDVSCPTCG